METDTTTDSMLSEEAQRRAIETLPPHSLGGLMRYLDHGIPPGDFLTAVICNDLFGACGRADESNKHALFNWCSWFYNYAPARSFGSKEIMAEWIATRRTERKT